LNQLAAAAGLLNSNHGSIRAAAAGGGDGVRQGGWKQTGEIIPAIDQAQSSAQGHLRTDEGFVVSTCDTEE
jgi:hypothetical protein